MKAFSGRSPNYSDNYDSLHGIKDIPAFSANLQMLLAMKMTFILKRYRQFGIDILFI